MTYEALEGESPKRRAHIAQTYRPDKALDRLLQAIERDPSLGAKLSPLERLRIGYYVQSKAAYDLELTEKGGR